MRKADVLEVVQMVERVLRDVFGRPDPRRHELVGRYIVSRSNLAGVHCGVCRSWDPASRVVELTEVRRIWSWAGALSLSEVALAGCGGQSRVTALVAFEAVCDVIELLQADEAGERALRAIPAARL